MLKEIYSGKKKLIVLRMECYLEKFRLIKSYFYIE